MRADTTVKMSTPDTAPDPVICESPYNTCKDTQRERERERERGGGLVCLVYVLVCRCAMTQVIQPSQVTDSLKKTVFCNLAIQLPKRNATRSESSAFHAIYTQTLTHTFTHTQNTHTPAVGSVGSSPGR